MSENTDVVVERVGERIHLMSSYFPGVADMCKQVPGHNWSNTKKCWTYPLSLMVCHALRRTFHDMLVIGPDLAAWAQSAKAREDHLVALGRSRDAELMRVPEIAPKIATAMAGRTYQRVGARFIAGGQRVGLWDQPSLGKTVQYLGGIVEAGVYYGQHLVAAPKTSLDTVWAPEITKWLDDAAVFYMPEGRAKREEVLAEFRTCIYPAKFLVINPEMLQVKMGHYCDKCFTERVVVDEDAAPLPDGAQPTKVERVPGFWVRKGEPLPDEHLVDNHPSVKRAVERMEWPELFMEEWDSIIFDEAHRYLLGIKGPVKRTQSGEGAMRLRLREGGVKVAASGTPMRGKVKNVWGMLHWLRPEDYSSYWHWASTYLDTDDNGFGITVGELRGDREREFHNSLDGVALRRTKREVQADLPEKEYQEHWVHMTTAQRKQYDAMLNEGESRLESGTVQGTGVLAEMTRLKQFAFGTWDMEIVAYESVTGEPVYKMKPRHSPKVDLLIEMLAERGVTGKEETSFLPEEGVGHKYMVASQYTEVVDFVERSLKEQGIEVVKITGAVTQKKRTKIVQDFQQRDGARVLVVNTTAAGVALTLDAVCDEMWILDETFVPDDQEQVEGRIDNRDVEKRVAVRTYHYLRTLDSVEEDIAEEVNQKDEIQRTLLDGRRGVEFALRLIRKRDKDA